MTIKEYVTCADRNHPGQELEQGGFAAAARSDDGDELVLGHLEAHAGEGLHQLTGPGGEGLAHISKRDAGRPGHAAAQRPTGRLSVSGRHHGKVTRSTASTAQNRAIPSTASRRMATKARSVLSCEEAIRMR